MNSRQIQGNSQSTGRIGLGGKVGRLSTVMESRGTDLRIAVVGCGYWGSKHVRVLHSMDDVAEVVVVDSCGDRARKLARGYKSATRSHAPARA